MRLKLIVRFVPVVAAVLFVQAGLAQARAAAASFEGPELRVLFLGDSGHHRPEARFEQIERVLRNKGIDLAYTDSLADLNPVALSSYDSLLIFANHTEISPEQEKALLDFVGSGGGLIPVHCASYCFLNSPKYIELVGAQFRSHGTGVFKETIVKSDHPIMKGLQPIESWDETYVHTKHNPNRTVLAERRENGQSEPYTWVREHGKGRVFYTAWGHDERTWGNEGFQSLLANGIRWASANSPLLFEAREGLKPFDYIDAPAPLPNYVAGARWGTQAEPIRTMQAPLEPEESMKHLVTPPEFNLSLFAAEPQIVKPIWLSWDEHGRLWIAETVDYPNEMQPPGEGRDRLKICEDTNGDGRADKFTVFADQLSVPTSFVFANGGVIVVHSGKTEFFKDTNGDDKADERKVLFTGWGTGDTHAGPSNFRFGFDGWIWGVVGYSGFRGEVGGKEIRFGQGIYRFKPDGSALEFVRSSNNNTWGLALSEEGIVFGSTANGNASMYLPIPNRYYEAVNGWSASRLETIANSQRFYPITEKVRQVDFHGSYTAGSGAALYTARSFPQEYWNRVQFVAEPTGHLLGQFYLEGRGADFIAHNAKNFAASDDEWTSPIAAEVGPDGALWVIDWYNYIIQHNPTPQGFSNGRGNAYETPLRDKTHGRIYRITHKQAKPAERPNLSGARPEQLVAALKNDNMLWRQHAQRLLVERGDKDVVPALVRLTQDSSTDLIGLNVGAIHALWTLHGLGALDSGSPGAQAGVGGLKHRSPGVRRSAVAVLPRDEHGLAALLDSGILQDENAQVRLAALLALSEMPASEKAGSAVYQAVQDPKNTGDRWLPDAITTAAARHDSGFLKAVMASYRPVIKEQDARETANLISNHSFENEQDGRPQGWRIVRYSGRPDHKYADMGRTGSRSVQISSEQGADASWSTTVEVKPRTEYRLSAWIKTEKLNRGSGRGAWLNIHELQDPEKGATKPISGDNDWTQVTLDFNSGQLTQITINCLFGGWGRATGTAWYDDVQLTQPPGAVLAGEAGRVVRLVTTHYAQRAPVNDIIPTLQALQGADLALAVPILDGLVTGWPQGRAPEIGAGEKTALTDLMKALPESARDRLLALSLKWGRNDLFGENIASIVANLRSEIGNPGVEDAKRVAAAKRLIALNDSPENVQLVLNQVSALTPPGLATGLINSLTEGRSAEIAEALTQHWRKMSPAARRAAVQTTTRRPEWTMTLLERVQRGDIPAGDIPAENWGQLRQSPNRFISRRAERLSRITGRISEDRQELVEKLLPIAKMKGDPARGKEVYVANCANCHVFAGEGGKIGPDLTGIQAKDRTEILLDVLDPNRSVEANYRLWNVTTKDGEAYSGRLEAETQTTVEILDVSGQKHVIQRKDITSLDSSEMSLMPSGFEALPEDDLKALLEYLGQPHS